MELSRIIVHWTLMSDALPPEFLRRPVHCALDYRGLIRDFVTRNRLPNAVRV